MSPEKTNILNRQDSDRSLKEYFWDRGYRISDFTSDYSFYPEIASNFRLRQFYNPDPDSMDAYRQGAYYGISAVQIGNLLVKQENLKPVNAGLIEVDLDNIGYDLANQVYFEHAVNMTRALAETDITGKNVVDFGAGSGVMGKIVLKYGAGHVSLIENDPEVIWSLRANFQDSASQKFEIIPSGFRQLSVYGITSDDEIGLVNVGPHAIYGGHEGAQLEALKLINTMYPAIRQLIIGGYGSDDSILSPDYILEQYQEIGFVERKRYKLERHNHLKQAIFLEKV